MYEYISLLWEVSSDESRSVSMPLIAEENERKKNETVQIIKHYIYVMCGGNESESVSLYRLSNMFRLLIGTTFEFLSSTTAMFFFFVLLQFAWKQI